MIQLFLAKSLGLYLNLMSYVYPKHAFRLAYRFFSQPRKGRFNAEKPPKILQRAQWEKHALDTHVIQTYIWQGNEEVILLVHGWESNASRWKKLIKPLLKTGKTIIALDAPAHGLSSGNEFNVPLYAEFIHKIVEHYQPTILIGHSVGGNAIAYYQKHYPHPAQKLILLGAPSDFKIILKNYIKLLGLNRRIYRFLKAYTQKRFEVTIESFSAALFVESLTLPGIIVHDKEDTVVLWEESEKIAKAWPHAEFITTRGLGHSLHDAYLYQTLIDFIEKP
ncbi:alpha/beta fold hydrolase [Flavobacterium sp.]|jgi:pimeloyl-ACP methyl ester carboxylesterase|uniref:alpha/beta fold hydrolase n=1 Tax=Flavobacterium sp. TaxID=239 RepID=UPI0022C11687|nr:alpha/beta fold hydrolase [Flavobacterium sp.]MCZ8143651.1 alpha/beta fold hydrolase [Flavobacterium sp.]MCZ8366658.1 alpha/beta fold hydrolase [Flavobacterium sp.]